MFRRNWYGKLWQALGVQNEVSRNYFQGPSLCSEQSVMECDMAFLFRRKRYGICGVICVVNKTSWNLEIFFSPEQPVIHLSKSWRLGRKFHETHNEILDAEERNVVMYVSKSLCS
jgi:hypothetical protein